MIDNSYSRRKFIRKLYGGTILLGGVFVLSCSSLKALAQEKTKTIPQDDPEPTPDTASQKNPQDKNTTSEPDPCDDLTGVSPEDLDKRKKLAYVTKSPIPDSHCSNCALHLPPAAGKTCGGCLLFKGPVRPDGYCAYWAQINK